MIATPSNLVKQYGVEAGGGHRAMPRALLAYSGPAKKRFLLVAMSQIMAGALPEYGQMRKWRRDVNQGELAAMCGITRESYTRAVSEFATPDESWNVDRRLAAGERTRGQHQQRRARVGDNEFPASGSNEQSAGSDTHSRADGTATTDNRQPTPVRSRKARAARSTIAVLIGRRRRFMRPNVYNWTLPEHQDEKRQDKWFPMTAAEVRRDADMRLLFARMVDNDQGFRKFKHIPMWLWSPKLPLTWKARLVMTF